MKQRRKTIFDAASLAQMSGNVDTLAKLIHHTTNRIDKGILTGMLACEFALRKRTHPMRYEIAMCLLSIARSYLIDEYKYLCVCVIQEGIIKKSCDDDTYADAIIKGRENTLKKRKK